MNRPKAGTPEFEKAIEEIAMAWMDILAQRAEKDGPELGVAAVLVFNMHLVRELIDAPNVPDYILKGAQISFARLVYELRKARKQREQQQGEAN